MFQSSLASLRVPGNIKSLDGLRAMAILLVLVTHICQRIPGVSFVFWNTEWATPLYNGWMGVDLFFVLSGFLIGSLIIKSLNNNSFSVVSFYRHRFFRILPAYFFMILLIICVKGLLSPVHTGFLPEFNIKTIIMNVALLTDYIPANLGLTSWSLSIEEHFYLLLPCFFIFFRKTETRVKACLILIFSALLFRMLTYRFFSIGDASPIESVMHLIYMPFHDRMDALSVGVLIALLENTTKNAVSENGIPRLVSCCLGLLLVGFVFVSGALQGGFFYTTIQYSLVCLGFGGLLWGVLGRASENKVQAFLSRPIWVPIARISYSVYLTHYVTIAALSYFFSLKLWMFFFILIFCLLAALPLYLFIEYPCHQFSKKQVTRRKEPLGEPLGALENN